MKNKIIFIVIIILVFMILLIPLRGSYAFYSDNKDLNIINTKVGDFTTESTLDLLNSEPKDLSPTIQGDMYRYQGTDDVDNWICFGTSSKDECLDNIDKYMYRIIGITADGEMKLIKETFIKEGDNHGFAWMVNHLISPRNLGAGYCPDGTCSEWNDSILYKRLNGISNGNIKGTGYYTDNANTNIFINSKEYDYVNDKSPWYDLIMTHTWLYGDTTDFNSYNGDILYKIESGLELASHSIGTNWNSVEDNNIKFERYYWTKTVSAKIGLMYLHDYYLSYYDGNEEEKGKPGNGDNAKKSWIHFLKDGYNDFQIYEWLMTRWGIWSRYDFTDSVVIMVDGIVYGAQAKYSYGVRPVFYVNKDVTLYKRNGTKEDPFIIKI